MSGNVTRIIDFNEEFNYERIAFDINCVGDEFRKLLKEKLQHDYVNHLHRLKGAYYFAIWNSDLQGFKNVDDIYFDSIDYDYKLARLIYSSGKWYYQIIEERTVDVRVRY